MTQLLISFYGEENGSHFARYPCRSLHRRLHEADEVAPERPPRRLNLDKPIIPGNGRKPFDLTNEQIYDLIEFP
jgi:hypothetical protein